MISALRIPVMILFTLFTLISVSEPEAGAATRQTSAAELHEITFAYFPLAVPIAPLAETMKRDRILHGNLEKLGLKIRFLPLSKGKDAVNLFQQNKLDGVSFSDLPTLEVAASGQVQILGFVKQSYSTVLAPSGFQIKDLRKKRIGTVSGSTSHFALLQALQSVGITEQEVSLVNMEAAQLPDALANGKIDALSAWEPTPTLITTKYPHRYLPVYRQTSLSYFVLSRQLIEQRSEAAKELTAALLRAIRWMKKSGAHLDKASRWTVDGMSAFTGKQPQLTAAEIARITTNDLLAVPGAPYLNASEGSAGSPLARMFDFMKLAGQLPVSSSWATVRASFNSGYVSELSANPSRYSLNKFNYAP